MNVFKAAEKQPSLAHPAVPAALPPELRALVDLVLKRAKLWKHERADVEAELAAHFADGLEAGVTSERLASDFGDPSQAARLIRRGKLRTRPFWWRAMRRSLIIATYALLAACVFSTLYTIRFYAGAPKIRIRPLDVLNAPSVGLPEDQKAWPLYRQAVLSFQGKQKDLDALTDFTNENDPAFVARAEPVLAANAKTRQLTLQAAQRPHMGIKVGVTDDHELKVKSWEMQGSNGQAPEANSERQWFSPDPDNPEAVSVLLPHLSELRKLARILKADALVALVRGEKDRLAEDLRAIPGLARHAREPDTLISCLVSIAILNLESDLVRRVLEERPELLSSEQLIALAHELHQLGGPSELVSLAGERLFFEDFIQRCYTDDGNGDGRFTPAGADYFRKLMAVSTGQHAWDIPVVSSAVFAGRKEMTDAYRRLFSEAEKSLRIPQFAPGPAAVEQELIALESTEWKRARFAPLGVLMPAFGHAARIAFRTALLRDATLTTIALELYRRKAGSIPESLSELVSTFLPSVPVDLADGQPIRYKRFGDSYTLYSIGSDRIDNGGKPPQTTTDDSSVVNFMSQNAKLNCDWVFFRRPHPEDTTPKTGGVLGGPGSK